MTTPDGETQLQPEEGSNNAPTVGSRGLAALKPPIPYLQKFFKCLEDPCDRVKNPGGHIALCVAENKLVIDLLIDRFTKPNVPSVGFSSREVYGYADLCGLDETREALACFFVRRFLMPDNASITKEEALKHISPKQVALASGCAAMLTHVFFLLGEAGDACLIPAPYYAAFENDINIIAGCNPVPVYMKDPTKGPTTAELETAFKGAVAKGQRVKFLLLTNPNNPLGVIYSPSKVRDAVGWARQHSMHTIVDEIYALSTHKKEDHGFQSVTRILDNKLGNDVHMLWAFSKDFGASGFRIGTVYSQNKQFMEAMGNINIFTGVGHPMQALATDLVNDTVWTETYLDETRSRLRKSYGICTKMLDSLELPYVKAEAGLFMYVDFSSLLPTKTFEAEAELCDLIANYARIVLTPGESQRENRPGMFRICYAWVSVDVLNIAMERLHKVLSKVREHKWTDLNDSTLGGIIV